MLRGINDPLINAVGPLTAIDPRFVLVMYGAGIIQMSGSIGGTTFAHGRFGNYARAKTKPVNPRSPRQMGARILMMMLSEQWRESPMTEAIRIAWDTYAQTVNWNNKLGTKIILTGFNHFIRSNAALITAGGSLITAAPTDEGLPGGDPTFAVTGSQTTQKLTLTLDIALAWAIETGAYISVEMGRPQSESRNFFDGPWRNAGSIAGVDSTGPTPPHELDAPFTLTETQKVWCRARIIRMDARSSTHFRADPFAVGA